MNKQVFISYHRDDEKAVKRLHDDLQKRGIKTWLEAKDINPGRRKKESIHQGIINSDTFIACLSPSFTQDEFCRTQTFLARAYNKQFLPIIINFFPPEDKDLSPELKRLGEEFKYSMRGLEDIHILDFCGNYLSWGEGSYEKNFEKLVESITPTPKPAALNSNLTYISFGSRDRSFGLQLAKDIELSRGLTWFYPLSTKAGDNWRESMLSGLQSANHFIILLSLKITQSENIKHELLLA